MYTFSRSSQKTINQVILMAHLQFGNHVEMKKQEELWVACSVWIKIWELQAL